MPERPNDESRPEETSADPEPADESKDDVEEQSEQSFPASDPPSY